MKETLPSMLIDAFMARRQGLAGVERRQGQRLAEMVAFARHSSPYYRELYRSLPADVVDPTLLPVTTKVALMANFNDWVTDPEVTLPAVRDFVGRSDNIGKFFRGKYTALTTSGTTGTRGMFLLDERTMKVTSVIASRMLASWLSFREAGRLLVEQGRMAMIMAAGSHFASAVAAARLQASRGRRMEVLRVDMALSEMVERLNLFQPALLAPYASVAQQLGIEQEAGRLRIKPVLVVPSAEGLPLDEYDRIAKAFDAKVRYSYAATECAFLSYSCSQNWLHVNSDWVIVEPVDADYRPTPRGQQSHTVLVSNLANRVQPILRYDLGDSLLERTDPCPCGSSLPAFRVQGRTSEALTFHSNRGEPVQILPMTFVTLAERVTGIERLQIVHVEPTRLRVRMRPTAGADPDRVWQSLLGQLDRLFAERSLRHVAVERADEPPQQSIGGKYREIIPLQQGTVHV